VSSRPGRPGDAEAIKARLNLQPHPEGGWYCETYRDPDAGGRGALTHIYFMLRDGERSRWHRIDAIEVWHFCVGDPLTLRIAGAGDPIRTMVLGADILGSQHLHAIVPAGAWQAAEPCGAFSLVGCTVAPAFRFAGLEFPPEGWAPHEPGP
jgi:uncharacterized protein